MNLKFVEKIVFNTHSFELHLVKHVIHTYNLSTQELRKKHGDNQHRLQYEKKNVPL